jgi:hypothetical protein
MKARSLPGTFLIVVRMRVVQGKSSSDDVFAEEPGVLPVRDTEHRSSKACQFVIDDRVLSLSGDFFTLDT